LKITYFHCK